MSKTVYSDGNHALGVKGTTVTAAALNAINNHRHDGQDVDGSGILDYYQDNGTANAIVITPSPALSAHNPGLPLLLKITATNTGATTVAVNGMAAKPVINLDGSALHAGQITSGQILCLIYDGTNYQQIGGETPHANRTDNPHGVTATQLGGPFVRPADIVTPGRGALVYNNGAASGVQSWSSEGYDTDNIHTSGSPTRLTVPAGVTKVRLMASLKYSSSSVVQIVVSILKNGSASYIGAPTIDLSLANSFINAQWLTVASPLLQVTAGDYFELTCNQIPVADSTGAINWFGMEIVL